MTLYNLTEISRFFFLFKSFYRFWNWSSRGITQGLAHLKKKRTHCQLPPDIYFKNCIDFINRVEIKRKVWPQRGMYEEKEIFFDDGF